MSPETAVKRIHGAGQPFPGGRLGDAQLPGHLRERAPFQKVQGQNLPWPGVHLLQRAIEPLELVLASDEAGYGGHGVEGFSWTFAYEGVEGLEGTPRAWVFTYDRVRLPGVNRARIVVSPTGKVLSTTPPDLEQRIERYKASLEP